jgi:hypothetical protein
VFSCGSGEDAFDIAAWNAKDLWKSGYEVIEEAFTFFAEDIFGTQFCLYPEGFGMFEPKTGDIDFFPTIWKMEKLSR